MLILEKNLENQWERIPFLGIREYLLSNDGVSDCGYVVDEEKVLPYILKKIGMFSVIQIPCTACGCKTEEEKQIFVDQSVQYLSKHLSPDVIYTQNTNICSVYPKNSEYCKFGSYIIDLSKSEDEIFNGFHTKHRNVIRKAIKDGLTVSHGEKYAEICSQIMADTYRRQGRNINEDSSSLKLSKIQNVDFWVVKYNEEVQGCAVLLWSKGFSSFYLHGGSIAHPYTGAINLMHWEAIKTMKQRGVLYYDFVGARLTPDPGSKLEGIQRFKSRFGGELKIGYMWRYVNHPVKYWLYSTLKNCYMRYVKNNREYKDIIKEERLKGNF